MRKYILILVSCILLCFNVSAKVFVNTKEVPSIVKSGNLMVEANSIFTSLEIYNIVDNDKVSMFMGNRVAGIQFGNTNAVKADMIDNATLGKIEACVLPVAPLIEKEKAYIPLKFLLDAFGVSSTLNKTGDTVITFESKMVVLDTEESIKNYLTTKYGVVNTAIGNVKLDFTVLKWNSRNTACDYVINSRIDAQVFYELMHGRTYSPTDVKKAKEQLKAHMKLMATDIIKRFPNYKFEGGYDNSYYRYEYIKHDLILRQFCTWKNHSGSIFDGYEAAKRIEFKWDTKFDEEQW